jgi:hypothetical protein
LEDYIFYEGPLPSDFQIGFEQAIFNRPDHLLLQSVEGWMNFFILSPKQKKAVASVFFHVADAEAKSPLRNPFGSIEFEDGVPLPLLFDFIQFVEFNLKSRKATRVTIKVPPQKYSHHVSLINIFLINNHYHISQAKVDSAIEVTDERIERILHRSERRRLAKAKKAGLKFMQMPIAQLSKVYAFIEACRRSKGYQLSLTLHDLEKTVEKFPDHYLLFGVFDDAELVAAAISIRVKQDVLYEFYHDHDATFNHLSPVVLLIEGVYRYCQDNSITLLDLGTSAADDVPNYGLLNFKFKLGAKPTPKLTFEKILS